MSIEKLDRSNDDEPARSYTEYYDYLLKVSSGLDDAAIDQMYTALLPNGPATRSEVLALFSEYGWQNIILESAISGQPTTAGAVAETLDKYTDSLKLDAILTINETIDSLALPIDQLKPSSLISKARQLIETSFQMDVEEYDRSNLLSCYILAYLSGDTSLYEELYAQATALSVQLGKGQINRTIRDFIQTKPSRLSVIGRVYGDATSDMVHGYNRYHLVSLIAAAAGDVITNNRAKQHRKAILSYARHVTYSPHFRSQLSEAKMRADTHNEDAATETLDWEVLPEGQLEEFAKEIVVATQSTSEKTQPSIDLRRLQILRKLRDHYGEDSSYYAKGVRRTRRIIRESDTEQPDEYIMLIIQRKDGTGRVVGEDAVAESPIAGPNALYVQREDVNGWDWRELMAYPKNDVRAMGARSIKHTVPESHDLVDWMTEKALTLLESSSDMFLHGEFKGVDAAGRPRLHISPRVLSALLAQQDLLE